MEQPKFVLPDLDSLRRGVRERYAQVASSEGRGCGCGPSCCSPLIDLDLLVSTQVGYSNQDLENLPAGADMGLGCGNPTALAGLQPGETVLDLGCGGGLDCFLAANQVGPQGKVIGVDMTPEMIERARQNALKGGYQNVEFRLGEIENLPVADNSVDVIISNCVINLSPAKQRVFEEAWRVLKAGGRLAITDIVATQELPPAIQADFEKYAGCVSGAASLPLLENYLAAAGFTRVEIVLKPGSRAFIKDWFPGTGVDEYVLSAEIYARK